MNCWAQSVVINGTKPSWRLVISAVSQGRILGPILPNIFMNHMVDGSECTLREFTDDTNWEERLIDQMGVLSFRGTSTGWRNGLAGIS